MRFEGKEVHDVASGEGILSLLLDKELKSVSSCLFDNRFAEALLEGAGNSLLLDKTATSGFDESASGWFW